MVVVQLDAMELETKFFLLAVAKLDDGTTATCLRQDDDTMIGNDDMAFVAGRLSKKE